MMYEDINGVPVPDSTVLRDLHSAFGANTGETVTDLFGDTGPLNEAPCLEPIDDDPTINALLAARNL